MIQHSSKVPTNSMTYISTKKWENTELSAKKTKKKKNIKVDAGAYEYSLNVNEPCVICFRKNHNQTENLSLTNSS